MVTTVTVQSLCSSLTCVSTYSLEHCDLVLQAYAEENGLTYWETSAKSNTNVSDMFVDIAKRLPQVHFDMVFLTVL